VQLAALAALNRAAADARHHAARGLSELRLIALDPEGRQLLASLALARGDTAAAAGHLAAYARELPPLPPTLKRLMNGPVDREWFIGADEQTIRRAGAALVAARLAGTADDAALRDSLLAEARARATDLRSVAGELAGAQHEGRRRTADAIDKAAADIAAAPATPAPAGTNADLWAPALAASLWPHLHHIRAERPGNSFAKKGFGTLVGHDGRADDTRPLWWASFHGNQTPPVAAQEMALLKAAELAADAGFDRLVLLRARDLVERTSQTQVMTGAVTATGVSAHATQYVFVPFASSTPAPAGPTAWAERAPHALVVTQLLESLRPIYAPASQAPATR
jgi:hypothetical protein